MMIIVEELERLKSILLHMANRTLDVINKTANLFREIDYTLRAEIWRNINDISTELDRVRKEFVNEVLVFIARRQPLGRELLMAHTLISIAYDVYRISRYCREIVRIDHMLSPESNISKISDIEEVFSFTVRAVEKALSDLIMLKPLNEATIMEIDNRVDEYYKKLLKDVISRDYVDKFTALKILIMRHIERIVDHANYIENNLKNLE